MKIDRILMQINNLKDEIEEAKQERSEVKGMISEQMKGLGKYGIKELKQASPFIRKKKAEVLEAENEITELFAELKEEYEW
jgi:hypothetical protein